MSLEITEKPEVGNKPREARSDPAPVPGEARRCNVCHILVAEVRQHRRLLPLALAQMLLLADQPLLPANMSTVAEEFGFDGPKRDEMLGCSIFNLNLSGHWCDFPLTSRKVKNREELSQTGISAAKSAMFARAMPHRHVLGPMSTFCRANRQDARRHRGTCLLQHWRVVFSGGWPAGRLGEAHDAGLCLHAARWVCFFGGDTPSLCVLLCLFVHIVCTCCCFFGGSKGEWWEGRDMCLCCVSLCLLGATTPFWFYKEGRRVLVFCMASLRIQKGSLLTSPPPG